MKQLFLTLVIFIAFISITLSQNFENTKEKLENPEHGQYQPTQYKSGHPYTTFYKPFRNNNIDSVIEDIRRKVYYKKLNEYYFYNIYKNIYTEAQITFSSENDLTGKNESHVAKNSYYAKHAAFVYLMGFNKEGEYLRGSHDTTKIQELYAIRINALERLNNIDYEIGSS